MYIEEIMLPLTLMQMLLLQILTVAGAFAILQIVNATARKSVYSSRYLWGIDLVVGIMYGIACYIIGLIYAASNFDIFIIYCSIVMGTGILLILFVRFCYRNRNTMDKTHIVLFLVYFTVLLYLTVFMRIGTTTTSVEVMPFDDLTRAVEVGDISLVKHTVLNVFLFIPFGYLVPAMNPQKLRKWSYAMLGGLMVSTLIEGVQMTVSLGECDIDDIIANTIGAVLGYVLMRMVWRVRKNWTF